MLRFATTEGLLEAFEKVTLRDRSTSGASSSVKPDKRGNDQVKGEQKGTVNDGVNKKSSAKTMRCYNCGERDHVSVNCPTKDQGAKCFKCGERGHVALKCLVKPKVGSESCVVSEVSHRKYFKNILLNGR